MDNTSRVVAFGLLAGVSLQHGRPAWAENSPPTTFACGDGKPNPKTKTCDCASGFSAHISDGIAKCLASAAPTSCPSAMAAIPGGSSTSSSPFISPFCLDLTEVTVKAYATCVNAGKCTEPRAYEPAFAGIGAACNWARFGHNDHPVNCLASGQAQAYCTWAGKRLPSTREWTWAARGGTKNWKYPWGNEAPSASRTNACGTECTAEYVSREKQKAPFKPLYWSSDGFVWTAPVGSFPAGSWGVFDMAGNVEEYATTVVGGAVRYADCGGSFGSYIPEDPAKDWKTQLDLNDPCWGSEAQQAAPDIYSWLEEKGFRCAKSGA